MDHVYGQIINLRGKPAFPKVENFAVAGVLAGAREIYIEANHLKRRKESLSKSGERIGGMIYS